MDEDEIRIDFERVGIQLVQREHGDNWDWYFLMQHYRAPTRLLDWIGGALLALYFATKDNSKERELRKKAGRAACDAAMWVVDPAWLNWVSIKTKLILLKDSDEAKSYLPFPFRKKRGPSSQYPSTPRMWTVALLLSEATSRPMESICLG